jgi:hypothetical protein
VLAKVGLHFIYKRTYFFNDQTSKPAFRIWRLFGAVQTEQSAGRGISAIGPQEDPQQERREPTDVASLILTTQKKA